MAAKPNRRLTHADRRDRRKRIAEAVKAGKSLPQVVRQFGVGLHTIKNACREYGVDWKGN